LGGSSGQTSSSSGESGTQLYYVNPATGQLISASQLDLQRSYVRGATGVPGATADRLEPGGNELGTPAGLTDAKRTAADRHKDSGMNFSLGSIGIFMAVIAGIAVLSFVFFGRRNRL